MARDSFPAGVAEQLKWYVYRLIDPRNGETFYVGKGRGNRISIHAGGEVSSASRIEVEVSEDAVDLKLQRIRDIKSVGLEVGHVVHRHGMDTERTAFEVEARSDGLLSGADEQGQGTWVPRLRSRHVEEIIDEYAGEEFEVREPLLLISIGVSYYQMDSAYDAVRYAWKINQGRVDRYQLVLANLRGMIVGAYRPTKWLSATRGNFQKWYATPMRPTAGVSLGSRRSGTCGFTTSGNGCQEGTGGRARNLQFDTAIRNLNKS